MPAFIGTEARTSATRSARGSRPLSPAKQVGSAAAVASRPHGFGSLRSCFCATRSPEGRQGAPLLEPRGEPSGSQGAGGAAACAVSRRDQRRAGGRWRKTIEIFDEGGEPAATDGAVPGGSSGAGAELRCRACPAQRSAAAPAAAMGWVLAGMPFVGATGSGSFLGQRLPPSRGRERVGIGCCKCWWRIGCSIPAASGDSIGNGMSKARWPICWARASSWRRITICTVLGQAAGAQDGFVQHLTQRWRDLFEREFDVLLYDLTSTYFESDPPFA